MKEKDPKTLPPKGEILIYKDAKGKTQLEVNFQDETVWLSQTQIAELFSIDRTVVTKHLRNIFNSHELEKNSVCAFFAHTANDGKVYQTQFYNLDAVISIGYRANSQRATQFRIWATKTLKDHLIKGYTINETRLKQQRELKLQELEKVIQLFQNARQNKLLSHGEADGLFQVITDYANSWLLLQKFDEEKLLAKKKGAQEKNILNYDKAKSAISQLKNNLLKKKEATQIFGLERKHGLEALLGNLNQSFGDQSLYPSLEEKAAHLLYFVIKDHPFVDGNKRIGSFLFIAYLAQNKYLFNKKG